MSDINTPEEVTNAAYQKHGAAWVDHNNVKDYWAKYMNALQHYVPSGRLLDVGCAGGRDAAELIERGYDYTGIDISDTFLDLARQRLPGHKFYKQSLYELDFPDKFDAFWAVAVLLHVPKVRIDEALKSIKNVLKTGAVGCITVKDGDGEGLQKDELSGVEVERFFSYWSKKDFAKALKRNGFKIEEYDYFPASTKTRWHCFIVRNLG